MCLHQLVVIISMLLIVQMTVDFTAQGSIPCEAGQRIEVPNCELNPSNIYGGGTRNLNPVYGSGVS